MGSRKAGLSCVALALSLAVGCGNVASGTAQTLCGISPDEYAQWRRDADLADKQTRGSDARRALVARLTKCKSLRGQPQGVVKTLLGPGETFESEPRLWLYYLGPDWLGIDSEFLYVEFSPAGRVVKVSL